MKPLLERCATMAVTTESMDSVDERVSDARNVLYWDENITFDGPVSDITQQKVSVVMATSCPYVATVGDNWEGALQQFRK